MAPNPVPRSHQVLPGVQVSIILKADQPTGRQVRGTVRQVLTRGDHHRGIKVRLADGRIGRVQSIIPGADGDSSTQSLSGSTSTNYPTSFPSATPTSPENTGGSNNQGRRPRYHDVRLEDHPDGVIEQTDLGAYIVPSRRKGKARKGANASQADKSDNTEVGPNNNGHQATEDLSSAVATCPVCGEFEGDEAAVAYHVAEHFGS
ncbi:hypothetical protein F4861DRAFT_143672 [Xylaria intraflava]|nr:hypothetical protein F4861DRAFT_143672 [Xylaria intraflava]